ncbi:toll/interleukin-1 receptor domain-containing protein [Nocardia bovistercoris]|uniref:TIR domain-containing protein n=1 Tax=Nocardia bovistercoris TaxID=2785916 RepID=A0A931I860_9NOCA|nr:TIR domain-containing protein [Nocardia bovistercoris]MBH0776624.1 TIR domain-containing protein [Nocardia bovistercoris]
MSAHVEAPKSTGRGQRGPFEYDAFLSYSHADRPVAAGIQKGLHRIGRRVGRLHALRVFRDATDLTASPDLWGRVTAAMDRARYMIVVLSPRSVGSEWVDREVAYWLERRGAGMLLFVVAGGRLRWDEASARFDPELSDVALPALTRPGALPTEPFYVDVRDDAPWDPAAALFREKVTDLAAPIHGKDKYTLASEDMRELRRFRRLRRAAVAGLVVLTIVALAAAGVALVQRREAIHQRDTAVAHRLAAESEAMLSGARARDDERAILEALASQRLARADSGVLIRTLGKLAQTTRIIRVGEPSISGLTIRSEGGIDIRKFAAAWSVAISPDGRRLVTGGAQLRMWDADTGRPIGEPFRTSLPATAVAFSPDGRRILTGGPVMRLWDTQSHNMIGEFTGYEGIVYGVAFSVDGATVVSGGSDGTVRLWDTATGRQLGAPMTGHASAVETVAFGPDGRRVVSGGSDKSVRMWDVVEHAPIGPPVDIGEAVASVAFGVDNRHVAIADQSGRVRLLDADSGVAGDPLFDGGEHTGHVVAFSPDGRRLAAAGIDATIRLWDTESGAPIGSLAGHTGWVRGLAFGRDGRLVSSSLDGTVRVWQVEGSPTGGQRITGPAETDGAPIPRSVAFLPDSHRMVAGYRDGTLRMFETDTGRPIGGPMLGHTGPVPVAVVSADGRRIASGGDDRTVIVRDTESGAPIRTLTGHGSGIRELVFSPDGRRIVSESADDEIRLWDTESGAAIGAPLRGFHGEIWKLAFSPDGGVLAGGGSDAIVHLWDTTTGAHIAGLSGHESRVGSVAFSPDGGHIISMSSYSLRIWDAATHELVSAPTTGPDVSGSLAVSGRGDSVVVGGANALRRWTVPTGEPIGAPMLGHRGVIGGVALSADDRILISGSMDRTLRFWDASIGAPIGDPLGNGHDDVARVALSADDRRILSLDIGADDTVSAWLWPGPSSWRDDLCAKVSRNMSHREWREWISPDIGYVAVCPQLPVPPDSSSP